MKDAILKIKNLAQDRQYCEDPQGLFELLAEIEVICDAAGESDGDT